MSGQPDRLGPTPPAIVVLGASNVSRGLSTLATVVTSRHRGPIDLFLAAGHGRSYGANSRVFMRRLPSILGCGLWRALDRAGVREERTVYALITDVGNDLLYGFPDGQLAAWVRESLARLTHHGARVAITRLPMASIERVGRLRYGALRTLYVPGCRLSLAEMKDSAMRTDAAVVSLARDFGADLIDQPGEWYGLDAIHVRRGHLATLWHRVCDAWGFPTGTRRERTSFTRWVALGSRASEVRSLARFTRFTPQPSYHGRDSLRLWLY